MFKKEITVKDQFGEQYAVEAAIEKQRNGQESSLAHLKYITIDGEDIRPGFDMCFQSLLSGKIFKLI